METLKVKLTVITCDVLGTATDYGSEIWVEDVNHSEGGSMQPIRKMFDKTKVVMDFMATVDQELVTGNVYTDGMNKFRAVGTTTIQLVNEYVDTFKLPEELFLAYAPAGEHSLKGGINE